MSYKKVEPIYLPNTSYLIVYTYTTNYGFGCASLPAFRYCADGGRLHKESAGLSCTDGAVAFSSQESPVPDVPTDNLLLAVIKQDCRDWGRKDNVDNGREQGCTKVDQGEHCLCTN